MGACEGEGVRLTKQQLAELSDKQIYGRAFQWDSRKADEMYFRSMLWQFAQGRVNEGFYQFLRTIIWKVNDEGKTIKYLHFNEYSQRISVDDFFAEWAKRTLCEMREIAPKFNQNANAFEVRISESIH